MRGHYTRPDTPPKVGGFSPWGTIQYAKTLAPGIVTVGTAGHGGIWVDAVHEAQIPEHLKAAARRYAPAQWYEEDIDWTIVAVQFGHEFTPDEYRDQTLATARAYFAKDARFHQEAPRQITEAEADDTMGVSGL